MLLAKIGCPDDKFRNFVNSKRFKILVCEVCVSSGIVFVDLRGCGDPGDPGKLGLLVVAGGC